MYRKMMGSVLRQIGFAPVTARSRQWAAGSLLSAHELRRIPRHELLSILRSLARGNYLGNQTAVCRVLGRYKMLVDTEDMGVGIHLLMEGFWEIWLTEVMLDLVKPGMCAVDIGANLGYFSVLMADLVGETGTLHAFEPNPPIADRLAKSLLINGFGDRATVHREAVSDRSGQGALIVPEHSPGGAFVVGRRQGDTLVTTRRFDEIEGVADADFIKIDVEGAEHRVWRGMRGVLDRKRPLTVVVEFTAARYQEPAAFVSEIVADGFSVALIDHLEGIVPIEPSALLEGPGVEEKLILLRR